MLGEAVREAVFPEGAVRTVAVTIVPCTEGVPEGIFLLSSITVVPLTFRAIL